MMKQILNEYTQYNVCDVMNHSTYHRGQLVTLMRGAGFTALSTTDLVSFYRL